MRIDGTPQWYMTGVARTGGGVRVYASRELSSADVDIDDVNHEQQTRLSAVGRNVLIIDGPDYGWCLNRIQEIWSGNPQPGWTPRPSHTRGLPQTYARPGDTLRVQMSMGNSWPRPALPDYPLTSGRPQPLPSRPVPLERASRPAPGNQPLAIEGPRGDDGDE